jgi:fatty-acyl-CoA synthase
VKNQGIGSWTARRARRTPGRTAVIHPASGSTLTYRQLHERACRLAAALRGLGVRRGDRVAYLGPNHPSFLETLFASGLLGAALVPLNTRLTDAELSYQLTDSGTGVLIHGQPTGATAPALHHRIALEAEYEPLLAGVGEPVEEPDEPVDGADLAMIMYTSGTTGRPKGAELTHANLTWNSLNVLVDHDLSADEVTLLTAPLFHTAALNMNCLPTLLKGGTLVIEPGFDPGRVLDLIERHRVTLLFGVPTMYDALAAHPAYRTADLSSVRSLMCGGAPVPEATARAWQKLGLSFVEGYGMTEASPGVLLSGIPQFFTDVRLDSPAPGEPGEITVNGPNVVRGYWGLPGATASAFGDGWFRTGDLGQTDDEGRIRIVGRVKDMFISGGENVYPAEVESALRENPAVADCAVIGVPDAKWGEVGQAFVVLADGAAGVSGDELVDSLATRLAKYKIPKSVVVLPELPRNASGKLVKSRLPKKD